MKKSLKKKNAYEIAAIILQVLVIALAIFAESTCVHDWMAGHDLTIDANFSMVILQIMATMATLTIALLAMMSGVLEENIAGVSVIDYVLNIRPIIYKQKIVIVASVLNVCASVLLHVVGLYTVVFALFICEIVFIIISSVSIYVIFEGPRKYQNEIKKYLID